MTDRVYRLLCIFLAVILSAPALADKKKFLPTTVPVDLKPVDYNEDRLGLGYNQLSLLVDWEDDLSFRGEEPVGSLHYKVNNLAVSKLVSISEYSIKEKAYMFGIVTGQEKTTQYYSPLINKTLNVSADISGYDVGMRVVSSTTFYSQKHENGKTFIDWNFAYSYYLAFFATEGTYKGYSTDTNVTGSTYKEEDVGFFFRPVISIQPIINISSRFSFVPYIALGGNVIFSSYYWWDTHYITNGSEQPGQLGEDESIFFDASNFDYMYGFDIGLITSQDKKHKLTLGGAIRQFLGGNGDYNELHVIYSFPL